MEDRSKYKSYEAFQGRDVGDECIERTREIYDKVTRKNDKKHIAAYDTGSFFNEVYTDTDFIDETLENEMIENEMQDL